MGPDVNPINSANEPSWSETNNYKCEKNIFVHEQNMMPIIQTCAHEQNMIPTPGAKL